MLKSVFLYFLHVSFRTEYPINEEMLHLRDHIIQISDIHMPKECKGSK